VHCDPFCSVARSLLFIDIYSIDHRKMVLKGMVLKGGGHRELVVCSNGTFGSNGPARSYHTLLHGIAIHPQQSHITRSRFIFSRDRGTKNIRVAGWTFDYGVVAGSVLRQLKIVFGGVFHLLRSYPPRV